MEWGSPRYSLVFIRPVMISAGVTSKYGTGSSSFRQLSPHPQASVPPGLTSLMPYPFVALMSHATYAALFSISPFFRYSRTNQLFAKTGSAAWSMMGVSWISSCTWGEWSGGIAASMTKA